MFNWILKQILGTKNERELKRIRPKVAAIAALEDEMRKLTDEQLRGKTAEFRQQLDRGAKLDDLLVPAFATCREASRRVLGMRHYDVQMIGGIALHEGKIAEMKTGEGKTLVATLSCYLNALPGKGVHVVTVNDYLARRDAEWMGKLYAALGLSTGVVVHSQSDAVKKRAYRCDITYGQNNEFGFDYLRDNMKFSIYDYAQRPLNYAIVDEVDSILIDEARTPLIISGPGESASDKYLRIDDVVPKLRRDEHYTVDEKNHSVALTEDGNEFVQKLLRDRGITQVENLYDPVNLETLHTLNQALKAHTLYKRDQHYMVNEAGKVLIIDEFTGRVLPGRRWSDGLHQAVEAKERVPIQDENRTIATISFQNLFRLYEKLSGMTGTAETEAEEFHKTYKLDVLAIPTNKPIQRRDDEDLVYKSERGKFRAVVAEIQACHEKGQPVLVGTTSVEKSDALSRMLTKAGLKHEVLNAKQHEREAYVVAQAGRKGSVTVATNMAGRGTDILLGGNAEMIARYEVTTTAPEEVLKDPMRFDEAIRQATERYKETCEREKQEVLAAGGLHILGTERHESRRIDNQLRGRAGRQGDPGTSRFYLSLEDDLMRIFAGERVMALMERLGMEEDVPIEHGMVTKSVANAQKKVEERNFDIRKHLLEYDDVMNQQRKTVYALRRQVLEGIYRTVPTDDEQKAGVKPAPHVEKADDQLVAAARTILTDMVKFHAAPLPPGEVPPEEIAALRQAALQASLESLTNVRTLPLERDVYAWFGCVTELAAYADKPKELVAHLEGVVGLSLTEQRERLLDLVDGLVSTMVEHACPPKKHHEDWDLERLAAAYKEQFGVEATGLDKLVTPEDVAHKLYSDAEAILTKKEQDIGPETFLRLFRNFYLQEIDRQWIDHLSNMEQLRDGIGLRGYGQRDPKKEYKREGYDIFVQMMQSVQASVTSMMFRVERVREEDVQRLEAQRRKQVEQQQARLRANHPDAGGGTPSAAPPAQAPARSSAAGAPSVRQVAQQAAQQGAPAAAAPAPMPKIETVRRDKPKVGRNDPCWCGSGKKYKQCHLRTDDAQAKDAEGGAEPTAEQ